MKQELQQTIEDIGYGLTPDFDSHPLPEKIIEGPNSWDEVTSEDFGLEGDYELLDHGDEQVFYPLSNAGLQWAFKRFPEDCDRWQRLGFKFETRWLELITFAASRDKLMAYSEYEQAMNELQELERGWA